MYGLNGQINHKMAFLDEFLPASCKITFIGHSIGCKIILEIMKELSLRHNQNGKSIQTINQSLSIHKSYLLFPTIERMKQTPAGRFTWIQVISIHICVLTKLTNFQLFKFKVGVENCNAFC